MRILKEPTLLLQALSAVLALVVGFGLDWLTGEQAALIMAAVGAVIGTFNALMVRPVTPAVFTGLISAVAALVTGYGLNLGQEHVGAVQAAVVAIMALVLRAQPDVSPVAGTAKVYAREG
jgi:uncharacterized membrane protein